MARGAWDVWASIIVAIVAPFREDSLTPNDIHPLRAAKPTKEQIMPYDPQVLQALQEKYCNGR